MAEWSASYQNDLPDSAFAYIAPGGHKDADGKTVPRELRYLPYKDATGKIDPDHLKNALARLPQIKLPEAAKQKAQATLEEAAKKTKVGGPVGSYEGSGQYASRSREVIPAEVMGPQTRTFITSFELRSGGDGRTVHGRAVPYGQTAEIPGGKERFVMGAFARQIAGGQIHTVKLWGGHQARLGADVTDAVGKTVELSERPDGLHAAFAMYENTRGETALHLVRTGEVTGLSIGFKALDGGTRRGSDGAFERHAAHLDHVVLTNEPAYPGAQVTAVRSKMTAVSYRRDLELAKGILARVDAGY